LLAHGTTVATNALLERRGGQVALMTTIGFCDIIEIARQVRPALYDAFRDRPEALVPRPLRFEVDPTIRRRRSRPFRPPSTRLRCASFTPTSIRPPSALLLVRSPTPAMPPVCSSAVSPEFREYERTVTTVVDAYLRRPCRTYLLGLTALAE